MSVRTRSLSARSTVEPVSSSQDSQEVQPQSTSHLSRLTSMTIPELISHLQSEDPVHPLPTLIELRRRLSSGQQVPAQEAIDAGAVQLLTDMLALKDIKMVFEACWCLTNLASGISDHTDAVVSAGVIPIFVRLMGSSSLDIVEQACWALGNIAGDSPRFRDLVLESRAMPGAVAVMRRVRGNKPMMRNICWSVSNFCRGKPCPEYELVRDAIPMLASLLMEEDDLEVLTDSCWATSYITSGRSLSVQSITDLINTGAMPYIVRLLDHRTNIVLTPALRAIGNIVTGSDLHTAAVVDAGVLSRLKNLLAHPRRAVRKEVAWTLSNITAGTRSQINAIIEEGILPVLSKMLVDDEYTVQKEAAWALANATAGGSKEQVRHIALETDMIRGLLVMLTTQENIPRMVHVCMEGLRHSLGLFLNTHPGEGIEFLERFDSVEGTTEYFGEESEGNFEARRILSGVKSLRDLHRVWSRTAFLKSIEREGLPDDSLWEPMTSDIIFQLAGLCTPLTMFVDELPLEH